MKLIEIGDYRPHEACEVQCIECGKIVISVHPVSAKGPYQCIRCLSMACYKTEELN